MGNTHIPTFDGIPPIDPLGSETGKPMKWSIRVGEVGESIIRTARDYIEENLNYMKGGIDSYRMSA